MVYLWLDWGRGSQRWLSTVEHGYQQEGQSLLLDLHGAVNCVRYALCFAKELDCEHRFAASPLGGMLSYWLPSMLATARCNPSTFESLRASVLLFSQTFISNMLSLKHSPRGGNSESAHALRSCSWMVAVLVNSGSICRRGLRGRCSCTPGAGEGNNQGTGGTGVSDGDEVRSL